jgi:predicted AAA+ superfamily ATPase
MLALYHLANAKNPEALPGLAEIFKEVGVTTLPRHSRPVVFVGTAAGANQPIAIEGARAVRSLWGLIAVKLGGWKAYEKIKTSDEARTNPGSEALIPILKEAAPASSCSTRWWRTRAILTAFPMTALSRSCNL